MLVPVHNKNKKRHNFYSSKTEVKFLYIKLNLIAHLQKLKIVWKLRQVKRLFTLISADMS